MKGLQTTVWLASVILVAGSAHAQVDPASGIDFVMVGAPGNPAWQGNGTPGDSAIGRGSVAYEYRIGKFEVTSAQWAEFFSAAFDRPTSERIPHLFEPSQWGGGSIPGTVPGGRRFVTTPQTAMLPAGGITWRTAAIYCNWLHNGKATNREAFLSGAYDVSTFGYFGNIFTDQTVRSEGARYFIPTLDEWIKGAHYDPNKANPDGSTGGYWFWGNQTDGSIPNFPLGGPPPSLGGNGVANYGWDSLSHPNLSPFQVPLGAYTGVTSPWGLFDVMGATSEYTESFIRDVTGYQELIYDGSAWNSSIGNGASDSIRGFRSALPNEGTFDQGFRIAAAIPSVGTATAMLVLGALSGTRRRRFSCGGMTSL